MIATKKQRFSDTPLLSEILPPHWDLYSCSEEGVQDLYDSLKKQHGFGRERSLGDATPEEGELVRTISKGVVEERKRRYNEALTMVGLDLESLERVAEIVQGYHGSSGEYLPITYYAPLISFLSSFFGDLDGRKIVEVGPRGDGMSMLGYLATQGAMVTGLDCDYEPDGEVLQRVKFEKGRWEDLANHFDPESLDAIYVVFMHDEPWIGGPFFDQQLFLTCSREADRKRRENILLFERHIATEMGNVLKPGGMFVIKYIDEMDEWKAEYQIHNQRVFIDQGYEMNRFRLERFGQSLSAFQKVDV